MQQGLGKAQPLPHAARQGLDLVIATNLQAYQLEHVIDELLTPRAVDP